MWLYVCVFGSKQGLGPLDGEAFGYVDVFTAAIVALCRVTLCVFVGQYAPRRLHYGRQGEVFRSDELDMRLLTFFFVLEGFVDSRVEFGERGLIQ